MNFLFIFLFATMSSAQAATELARVGSTVITLEEFNRKYEQAVRLLPLNPPSKKQFLEGLVKRAAVINKARETGLSNDPVVKDALDDTLARALVEKELSKKLETLHISDQEAASFYKKNPEIRTSQIYVALAPNADKQTQEQALSRIKKIQEDYLSKKEMSFAEIAQKFSDGPAAPVGGDMNYLMRDQLDSVYYEAAVKLGTPGKISGIVRSSVGYHIIKLTAVRPWEEVDQARVKRLAFSEQQAKMFDDFMASVRKQASSSIQIKSELVE